MKTHPHRALMAALLLALLGGCGSTRLSQVMTGSPAPPHQGPVRVLMENEPPPPGFAEIALVQAAGYGTHADLGHVVSGLMRKAQELGCTWVIRVRVDQGSSQCSGVGVCGVIVDQGLPTEPPRRVEPRPVGTSI